MYKTQEAETRAMERRQQARYRIPGTSVPPDSLKVGISVVHNARRHDLAGVLLDISESGFCTRLLGEAPKLLLHDEVEIAWEIHSPLGLASGQASIRRRHYHGDDLLLGLHVDSGTPVLKPLVDHLRSHWNLGCISLDQHGQAQVHGRLHFDTARQLVHLTRRVKKIDLSRCNGIDGAGIGVIDLAVSRGVALTGCSGDVRALLTVAGICGRCDKLNRELATAAP